VCVCVCVCTGGWGGSKNTYIHTNIHTTLTLPTEVGSLGEGHGREDKRSSGHANAGDGADHFCCLFLYIYIVCVHV
jgi:hypothetical protein